PLHARPWHRRPHSHAITAPARAASTASQGSPNQIAASGTGARTAADSILNATGLSSARLNRGPVAALAAAKIGDGLLEIGAPEIGPQRRGEDQFGIGA